MPMPTWMSKFWEGGKSLAHKSTNASKSSIATVQHTATATARSVGRTSIRHMFDLGDSNDPHNYKLNQNQGERGFVNRWRDPAQSTQPWQSWLGATRSQVVPQLAGSQQNPPTRSEPRARAPSSLMPNGFDASRPPSEFSSGRARRGERRPDVPSHDVLLLSWDDVLFPTSSVLEAEQDFGDGAKNLHTHRFARHGELVTKLLRKAVGTGATVFIVCSGRRPWLEVSSETYLPTVNLPKLAQELGIKIIYTEDMCSSSGIFDGLRQDSMNNKLFMTTVAAAVYEAVQMQPRVKGGIRLNISAVLSNPHHRRAFHKIISYWSSQQLFVHTPIVKCIKLPDTADFFSLSNCLTELVSFVDALVQSEQDHDVQINHPDEFRGACLACVRKQAKKPTQQVRHRSGKWSWA